MQEDELLRQILTLARQYDVLPFHCYDSRKTTGPGFPDVVLAGKRELVFAELKTEYSTLTTSQTDWKYRIMSSGNVYEVWRPKDVDHAEAIIREL